MDYVVGSLERYKLVVNELKKEDEIQGITVQIMRQIEQAIEQRKAAIVIDTISFEKVAEMFVEDGYNIAIVNDEEVELSGWM